MAFPNFRGGGDLEEQVARLTAELTSLKNALARNGASAYEDTRETASDLYAGMRDRFQEALPLVRKRAQAVEQVARDNPGATAAAVGLVVVGLLVTLLLRNTEPAPAPNRRSKR